MSHNPLLTSLNSLKHLNIDIHKEIEYKGAEEEKPR